MLRKLVIIAGIVTVQFSSTWITGRFVPFGADPNEFLFERVKGPVLTSPDGTRTVRVYFHDSEGHDGNHWAWFVESHWAFGSRVVSQGYLSPGVLSGEAIPATWTDGNRLEVRFRESQYDPGSSEDEFVFAPTKTLRARS